MTDAIAAMREHARGPRARELPPAVRAAAASPATSPAVVDEGGPVVEEITAAIEAGGNGGVRDDAR